LRSYETEPASAKYNLHKHSLHTYLINTFINAVIKNEDRGAETQDKRLHEVHDNLVKNGHKDINSDYFMKNKYHREKIRKDLIAALKSAAYLKPSENNDENNAKFNNAKYELIAVCMDYQGKNKDSNLLNIRHGSTGWERAEQIIDKLNAATDITRLLTVFYKSLDGYKNGNLYDQSFHTYLINQFLNCINDYKNNNTPTLYPQQLQKIHTILNNGQTIQKTNDDFLKASRHLRKEIRESLIAALREFLYPETSKDNSAYEFIKDKLIKTCINYQKRE